jgi:hypothetical protein
MFSDTGREGEEGGRGIRGEKGEGKGREGSPLSLHCLKSSIGVLHWRSDICSVPEDTYPRMVARADFGAILHWRSDISRILEDTYPRKVARAELGLSCIGKVTYAVNLNMYILEWWPELTLGPLAK